MSTPETKTTVIPKAEPSDDAPQPLDGIVDPHENDVLSGRGNFVNHHKGNAHHRALVKKYKVPYLEASKKDKRNFSVMIVDEIRHLNPPGRFLKQDATTKLWSDIGDAEAVNKTRQALREGAPELLTKLGISTRSLMTDVGDDNSSEGGKRSSGGSETNHPSSAKKRRIGTHTPRSTPIKADSQFADAPETDAVMPMPSHHQSGKNVGYMSNPLLYQGMSTSVHLRSVLGVRGLLPAGHIPVNVDAARCMEQFRSKSSNLEKYLYLQSIQDVNEQLYFAILVKHTQEVMPVVWRPTVEEACQSFSSTFRGTMRGLYLSLNDIGSVRKVLDSWPSPNVTTIVVTDGERVLGLGDQGVNSMAVPIGKLALYTTCAGIDPSKVLPVQIDVGTNNEDYLADPYYLGLKRRRDRGIAYDTLIEEFINAVQDMYGRNVLIQLEGFGSRNSRRLLTKYQDRATTFNDDIQGTAAVALAGLLASNKITGKKLADHTFLLAGSGEAGRGVADLIAYAVSIESGCSVEKACESISSVDFPYDIDVALSDILSAVRKVKPTVLIGVSGMPKAFNQEICEEMAKGNDWPIIFVLSNSPSKTECTAREAYTWTGGKAIFSSGCPSGPVKVGRHTFVPCHANNAYIFPGVGLGVLASGSTRITDHDVLVAAQTLAAEVTIKELSEGSLYPPMSKVRDVACHIAKDVALQAHDTGVASRPKPPDMFAHIKALMYDPFRDSTGFGGFASV